MTVLGASHGRPATVPPTQRADPARTAGIGELVVSNAKAGVLAAYGLGSCVALTCWDPVSHVGGVAHFMLPAGERSGAPAKYVDTGMPTFLSELTAAGARTARSQFKAVGGAAMLVGIGGSLEVGRRNIAALHAALRVAKVRLIASDLGGLNGRTIELDLATGRLNVKTILGLTAL
jgi:chemotaxis protein CheD